MFMQENSNKIARQYTFIEDEIVAVKENSFILKDDFEEFSQSMAEKMDQMNSTSNSLSTWNEQPFSKNKRHNSIQAVKEANGLRETPSLLPKKLSDTHPILQASIRRCMSLNIKRNNRQNRAHSQNDVEEHFFFDIKCSITTSKNQEVLDNYINEY